MPNSSSTPKGKKRTEAIIQAAQEVFIENGYAATTIGMIIDRSGGSRSTIYEAFGNKEGLFSEVINTMVGEIFDTMKIKEHDESLYGVLCYYGERFLRAVLHPKTIGLFRLVVSESLHSPEVGICFYQEGPSKCYQALLNKLYTLPELQNFSNKKLRMCVHQYLEMLKGHLFLKAVCLPNIEITDHDIQESLQAALDITLPYLQSKVT